MNHKDMNLKQLDRIQLLIEEGKQQYGLAIFDEIEDRIDKLAVEINEKYMPRPWRKGDGSPVEIGDVIRIDNDYLIEVSGYKVCDDGLCSIMTGDNYYGYEEFILPDERPDVYIRRVNPWE